MSDFKPVGPTVRDMQRANDAANAENTENTDPKKKPKLPKPSLDPECVICQNEGPRGNLPGGKHQHIYEGQE